MRFNAENTTPESEWLCGALAGALIMFFLFLTPHIASWIKSNLIILNPIQAFIQWGTAKRVVEYTVFDVVWSALPIIFFTLLPWVVIQYMMLHKEGM